MPYARDHRQSSLMSNEHLTSIIDMVFDSEPNEATRITFDHETSMLAMERKIRVMLRKLGRSQDFCISRLDDTTLSITGTIPVDGVKTIKQSPSQVTKMEEKQ